MTTQEQQEEERRSRALMELATSTSSDLYSLLDLSSPQEQSAKTIKKAYHQAALRWHPDKNRGDEVAAAAKLDAITKAYDLLKDEDARRVYDDRWRRRRQKAQDDVKMDAKRKAMIDDLLRGEAEHDRKRGVKRKIGEEETPEEKQQAFLAELAAKGARRRKEKEDELRAQAKAEADERAAKAVEAAAAAVAAASSRSAQYGGVEEQGANTEAMDERARSVRVRWPRQGVGEDIDKAVLTRLLESCGEVDMTVILKDKKLRPATDDNDANDDDKGKQHKRDGSKSRKQIMATGVVVFISIVSAHAAVYEFTRPQGPRHAGWDVFTSVEWLSGWEPDLRQQMSRVERVVHTVKSKADAIGRVLPNWREMTLMQLKETQREIDLNKLKDEDSGRKSVGGAGATAPD